MSILDGLNDQQLVAARHTTGPQLVIAGAGTGKTQVITRRIAHLIESGVAKPQQILALTFTEKAAREMQERLYELIGWESFQVAVQTFNAFGVSLLGRYSTHIGRSIRGGLINDTQKTLILKQHIDEISFKYYGPQTDMIEFLDGLVAYIGELQNKGITVSEYQNFVDTVTVNPGDWHPRDIAEQADLLAVYAKYEELKERLGLFDYSDQLHIPLRILEEKPHLAERLGREYHFVLVDEYQDTNRVQDALLRKFIGSDGNIFAVGDDDQAIYGFRGADIENILDFTQHFSVAAPVALIQNYRSGQSILDAAYALIQHNNPHRLENQLGIGKRLVALPDVADEVNYRAFAKPAEELEATAEALKTSIEQGDGTVAVLAATHAPLRSLAKILERRGVPYALSTWVSIFSQPEMLSSWHLLKWLALAADDEAISHVLMGPYFSWTPAWLHELAASEDTLDGLEAALRSSASEMCVQAIGKLDEWRGWAQTLPVSQLVFRLVFDTGVGDEWQRLGQSNSRILHVFEDLHRLLEHMQDFESVAVGGTLREYLQTFPKPPELETQEPVGDANGVQLLTVHASKGLEFDEVYIIGCTAKSWSAGVRPGRRVPEELLPVVEPAREVEEFRRLMYVAITRAKRRLMLSSSVGTAGGSKQQVSPLLIEALGESKISSAIAGVVLGPKQENSLIKLQRFYPLKDKNVTETLPFEDGDGWLNLSVTALGGYEFCPFEFYLQHVLGIAQPMGPQLAFGTALHGVFEQYYGMLRRDGRVDERVLHAMLDEGWSNKGYDSHHLAEADRALAHTTLDNFLVREGQTARVVLGVEMPIRFEIPEARLRLRGKIDLLEQDEEGSVVRDFKTGRTKTDASKLDKLTKDNFQLRTYALALEVLQGLAPSTVVLDYVVTGVEGSARFSPTILRNHRDKLVTMAENIRARAFAPNASSLHVCSAIRYYGTGEADELAFAQSEGGN